MISPSLQLLINPPDSPPDAEPIVVFVNDDDAAQALANVVQRGVRVRERTEREITPSKPAKSAKRKTATSYRAPQCPGCGGKGSPRLHGYCKSCHDGLPAEDKAQLAPKSRRPKKGDSAPAAGENGAQPMLATETAPSEEATF